MLKRFKKNKDQPVELAKKVSDRAVEMQSSTSKHVGKYLTKRTKRLQGVSRFTIGWLVLALGLCLTTSYAAYSLHSKSKVDAPTSGGTYIEGVVGKVNNLNPLFATGVVDQTATKLMFNGLLRYDQQGEYTPDLAEELKISPDGKKYTLTLKEGVRWHDGDDFTSRDVLYTIKTIQNPATRSPLESTWKGVKVSAKGELGVEFSLTTAFAPFKEALTQPILPAHILEDVEPSTLRTSPYSNSPIGTGPFVMQILRESKNDQQLEFQRNQEYYRGIPKLERFVIVAYEDESILLEDLKNREITAAAGLGQNSVDALASSDVRNIGYPLNYGTFAFFKTSVKPLDDADVRRALVLATDRMPFLELFQTRYQPLKTPLLQGQVGQSSKYNQQTDFKQAQKLLEKAGWKIKDGVRVKGNAKLELALSTSNRDENSVIASELQRQWKELGIVVKPQLLNQEQLEQTAIAGHDFQIFLSTVALGTDPDMYVYWHSSQAKPGLRNFSQWKNDRADLNLDVGRTRLDPVLRKARYEAFQDEWQKQAPAVALYRPQLYYSHYPNAAGFKIFPLTNTAERLTNVEQWTIETRRVTHTP